MVKTKTAKKSGEKAGDKVKETAKTTAVHLRLESADIEQITALSEQLDLPSSVLVRSLLRLGLRTAKKDPASIFPQREEK